MTMVGPHPQAFGSLLDHLEVRPEAPLPGPLVRQLLTHLRAGRLRRDRALVRVAALLDPEGGSSTWSLAQRVARTLAWFESTSYRRIRDGHREPRTDLEQALVDCLDCPALLRHPRKIWDVLARERASRGT